MKKIVSLATLAALPLFTSHAQTIADWTFESTTPTTAGPFSPEIGLGSASGSHAGAAVYSSPAGNGSSHSFSANTWAVGDYYQFLVQAPQVESSISLSFDQTSSSTGPGSFTLETSTDGITYTPFASYAVLLNGGAPNASWNGTTYSPAYTFTYNLGNTFGNTTHLFFELVDSATTTPSGGTVASTGTDRVDNFVVSVTPVPEPGTVAMCLLGGVASLFALRRRY